MVDDKDKPAGRGRGGAGKRPGGGRDGQRKPFAKKGDGQRPSFAKRRDEGGEARAERPKREFRRDDRPRAEGERKPFRKREDGDGKPFAKRRDDASGARSERPTREFRRDDRPRAEGERKPFRKREDGDGKPFAKRRDDAGEARSERPKREFRRDDRPRAEGERKPFPKREEGDRKPFRKNEEGERKPFRKREEGEGRPFAKREGERPFRKRGDEHAAPRPGRRERTEAATETAADDGERIARRLARAGVASRRDAEEMIAAGRVTLNGKVLDTPAVNVSARDRIELDGKPIPAIERTRLFLFHKPAGVVTTNRDPEGRKTVFDILPAALPRLMTVGRLDINTEGLLLLTNDGGLSRVLELPATGWLRRYRVRVHGKVEPEKLTALSEGIAVDGVFYGAIEATLDREQGSNAWLTIGLREGKNREVKNILGALGLDVTRLIRLSYGPFQLGELAEGEVRELKGRLLRDQLGERLIEEAGANFDAPVLNEFSNKPVAARPAKRDDDNAPRPNRKREREAKREDALGRLQTKPDRKPRDAKGKPGGFGGGRQAKGAPGDERKPLETRSRTSNVWMAPGARPMGEKKAAALAERSEGRRYAGKPRPAGKPGGKPGPGKDGPRKPRGPK